MRDPHEAQRHATATFASSLVAGLRDAGVEQVIASPGSRSTPLVLAAHRTPGLAVTLHHDERSAGFFALGLAKARGVPVALLCTSGSAAANYLPAVVEACYACVPLIVLTADRPPELRNWGAGQTIDQTRIYGSHARAFVELPIPSEELAGATLERIARSEAVRAVTISLGRPAGPVHLNCPFREPLEPPIESPLETGVDAQQLPVAAPVRRRRRLPEASDVDALVRCAREHPRGLILCGAIGQDGREQGWPDALHEFASAAGWPVIADPLSQLRRGPQREDVALLAASDLYLREARFANSLAPQAVLRIGASPTSKALRLWLEAAPPRELILLDPDEQWNDPSRLATQRLAVEPGPLLFEAARKLRETGVRDAGAASAWKKCFEDAEAAARATLDRAYAEASSLLEPEVTRAVAEALPPGAVLVAASSMAIRDVDAFLPASERPLRVLANRGANGIDGTVSTALGIASAGEGPVALLTGDLAFLHDIGGLAVARRLGLEATIVVMNNDGGGIFSFLPIAERSRGSGNSAEFEALFHTPHGLDLTGSAALFGIEFERVHTREALVKALERSCASPGVQVIEVPIDRDANVTHFRALVKSVGEAVAERFQPSGPRDER